MTRTVVVDPRHCGPPQSGNGGYTSGLAAAALGRSPAEVVLRVPPPLGRPLTVTVEPDEARLADGDTIVATARPCEDEIPEGPIVPLAEARAVVDRFDEASYHAGHPYPGCFTCGPSRAPGDGLRIFPGPTDDPEVVAWVWTPGVATAGEPPSLPVLWAALDCPGGLAWISSDDVGPAVLGRMAVRVDGTTSGTDELVVTGWRAGRDGRKLACGSAIHTADGRLIAASRATWLELTPEQAAAFGAAT